MKNIKLLAATLLLVSLSFSAFADGFTGSIKYKISAEGRELTPQEQSQMATELNMHYRDNMMMQENVSPMASYYTIVNNTTLETTILFDMMGQKLYTTIDGAVMKAKKDSLKGDKKPEIKLLDGTKTIAGYACKKAEVTSGEGDKKVTITVYYTEDIKAENEQFEELPGYPLEYTIPIPGDELELVYRASEVSTKKPKKKLFKIPSDFEEMPEQMRKQMGL